LRICGSRKNGAYEKAFGQLATGKDNVLGKITRLKTLGLMTSKKMPTGFQVEEPEGAEGAEPLRELLPGLAEPPVSEG
jgi:hypothetical protein